MVIYTYSVYCLFMGFIFYILILYCALLEFIFMSLILCYNPIVY